METMSELDLNLLRVLVTLDEQRSVSRAALKLGRSQPAISAALSRLRKFFDDRLFLRAGNLMQPTARAAGIVSSARAVLERIESEIVAPPVFDPAVSDRPVRLALSDVGEVVFLPAVLQRLRTLSPKATVCSVSLPAQEVPHELERGGIDLAIGYFPDLLKSNCFQQVLFTDGFAGLIRADHPISASRLTLKQFLQLEHAVVRVESRTEEVIERFLAKHKIQRRVVLTTPHFASTPIVVAHSDLLVTVPEPLARYFSKASANLRVVGLPFEPPRIELRQFWHHKLHTDPRNRWLRTMIYELFRGRRAALSMEHPQQPAIG
jgi:DNA-binding transcriptional LysR family regulator